MRNLLIGALFLGIGSCTTTQEGTLCERMFEPYPDMISGRARTSLNGQYLDAMALYAQGELAGARDGLRKYIEIKGFEKTAHIYLASCYLALNEPFEAELQLDHLERASTMQFKDQTEWYTVLCWLCSEQDDRALTGSQRIATSTAHTYKAEAAKLLEELRKQE